MQQHDTLTDSGDELTDSGSDLPTVGSTKIPKLIPKKPIATVKTSAACHASPRQAVDTFTDSSALESKHELPGLILEKYDREVN